ncbi:MAG: hypothetical protein O3A46_04365 [Candidatus Poribacteria bacterium]|nr:hypothetical protein [Candidatus Poribacteria bacterium]
MNNSKATDSDAIVREFFADPWRRYRPHTLLYGAARLYLKTVRRLLPVAALLMGVGVAVGVVGAVFVRRQVAGASDASAVALGASWATLVYLSLSTFAIAPTINALLRVWTGERFTIPRIRYYRLVGAAIYLTVPAAVMSLTFPLGILILALYVWWMFVPHIVLLEGDGGRTAMRRSRTLSMGEFSGVALPTVIVFTLFFLALAMTQRLTPSPPSGFNVNDDGDYVRALQEGESYAADTLIITGGDGKLTPMPPEAAYDEAARTLTLPAPEPPSLTVALLWGALPFFVAALFDPIRWVLIALLYWNLRMRREGLTLETLRQELTE